MKKGFVLLTFLCSLLTGICNAYAESFNGYTVANEGAWCWFADPRATHYENASGSINMSYIGYIDVHGNIKATQYNWLTGEKSDVLIRSYFQPDDHNNPTFLVLPDERVLIIYSRHTDEAAFYYRVSTKPGDITCLGEEKRLATANNTTYPSPFIMSDDPEHWYLCWRGISWHPTIARLTLPDEKGDCKFDWGPFQMVQSTGARPYAKYYSNGKDKLYVTYTTGHPDNESPNWIYFNVININKGGEPTLEDIKGNKLSTIKNGAFKVYKTDSYKSSYPYTVVDAPSNGIRDWVWQIALDKNERPRIAMVKINSAKSQHEYYYARWTGSSWALTDICDGGAKFHPSNTEYCYSGGEALDQQNPNIMYVSKPTAGAHGNVFEIWKYTLSDNGTVKSSEQITKDSKMNNVRPFVLPNSDGTKLRLSWMNGEYFYWIVCGKYPKGYPTSIQCDYEWTPSDIKNNAEPAKNAFTYSTTLKMDASKYYGELLTLDNGIKYTLDATTHRPYITIGGKRYDSQNQLYTSDAWQTCPATTDGKSYYSILDTWNLSIAYNGSTLYIYRNGLIDQVIEDITIEAPKNEGVLTECLPQHEIQQNIEKEVLNSLFLPRKTSTDVVLPTKVSGENIEWTSSNADIIDAQGTFSAPTSEKTVVLTATIGSVSRQFTVTAMPRNLKDNLLAHFTFDKEEEGITLMGSAKLNKGKLDLSANTANGFSTNGYAVVDPEVMDSLRSYTILFEATPKSVSNAPRFYDFGYNSGNSIFCRVNTLCAGIKYAGGSTTMTNSSATINTGKTYKIAVTFNARTKTTSIYVNGELTGSGIENQNEAYMISMSGKCTRNYIGRTQWWDSNVASSNVDYVGTIDNFSIYNTTLTRKEVCDAQGLPFETGEYKTTFDNGDFEDTYSVFSNPTSDRAIYQPKGWTVDYGTRDNNDLTALKDGDFYYSNFFAGKTQNENGGSQTLWVRQRWGTSVLDYYQNVLLPEGNYTLSADVYATSTTSSNKAYVYINDNKQTPARPNTWQTITIEFASNGEEPTKIGLEASHISDEFICGFDNFILKKDEADAITAGKIHNATDGTIYDLAGRKAGKTAHGILIQNGKKIIR